MLPACRALCCGRRALFCLGAFSSRNNVCLPQRLARFGRSARGQAIQRTARDATTAIYAIGASRSGFASGGPGDQARRCDLWCA